MPAMSMRGTTLNVVNIQSSLPAGVTYDAAAKSFTLDPSHAAYQSLALNATTTVTVTYAVSDGITSTPGLCLMDRDRHQ